MILIIQGQLPHYRRELFNALCSLDEVTVVHSGEPAKRSNDVFCEIILPVKKVGSFFCQQGLCSLISNMKPKTIISMFDVRWMSSVLSDVSQ